MAVTVTHATVTAVPDDPAYDIGSDEWNAAHTVTNALDKTGDTMTGALAISLGTITTSNPAWNITQTWNAGAVTFTGLKLNVTNTASASGSLLMDLQAGGTSVFAVYPGGSIGKGGSALGTVIFPAAGNALFYNSGSNAITARYNGVTNATEFNLCSKGVFAWTQTANDATDTRDAGLGRNAAGVVEVNNATLGTYRDLLARNLITNPTTVAGLTAAVTGARSFVTDANATTFASVVAGGGANGVPVYYDGTNWRIG